MCGCESASESASECGCECASECGCECASECGCECGCECASECGCESATNNFQIYAKNQLIEKLVFHGRISSRI